ncbi:synaptonemal complex protein 1-like isoform X2 [Physella acuta]|uniref:synaptonemal complex protein 1-like isoform X2 n=1 Tax=Physella acuta TaxID=109671 RepID=UPI0027DD66BB|nr:synaptonemal complex protein 1-like isoform X2 [Physella acuta]XP_059177039.1 synaptonemal complex protein 1-like isoform X2 [Physella acuta]
MNGQPLFRFQPQLEVIKNQQENARDVHSTTTMAHQRFGAQQQLESEQMSTLHVKLHKEADKIRKWKIQTDVELKEKEKKLIEASQRIETMKKSLLELQLENERTSAMLQEEISNREEVLRRINSTREMCTLLKCHAARMEDRLMRCETEKTELKYIGKEHMQQFEELTLKFNKLQITALEREKQLQDEVNSERKENAEKSKEIIQKLADNNKEIQMLKDNTEIITKELCSQNAVLEIKECKLTAMMESVDDLQKKVSCLTEDLLSKDGALKESLSKISELQKEKLTLENMIETQRLNIQSLEQSKDKMEQEMKESQTRLEEQLSYIEKELQITQEKLDLKLSELQNCETKLTDAIALVEELKNSKDLLIIEKMNCEMNLDVEKFQVNNLLAEKNDDKEEIGRLNNEISMLTMKLDRESSCKLKAQEENEVLQTKISCLLLERDNHIKHIANLNADIEAKQEKCSSLECLLSEEENKNIRQQNSIGKLEEMIEKERLLNQQLEKQVLDLIKKVESNTLLIADKEKEVEVLHISIENLKSVNTEKENEVKNYTDELELLRSNTNKQLKEIQDLKLQISNLNNEMDKSLISHESKITITEEQNKELENEIQSLKGKLEFESKVLSENKEKLLTVEKELDWVKMLKEEAEMAKKNCEEEVKKIKKLCADELEKTQLAMEKAILMQSNAQKEKDNALKLTDAQLTEMMATLDSYKQNNEKLVCEKNKEIQSLTMKMDNEKAYVLKLEKELTECKAKIEQLTVKLKQKNEENPIPDVICTLNPINKVQTPTSKNRADNESESIKEKKNEPSSPKAVSMPVTYTLLTPSNRPTSCGLKTPQRSILRVCNSVTKRRKVAFANNGCDKEGSSDESDLMELDTESKGPHKPVATPILKSTPKSGTPSKIPLTKTLRDNHQKLQEKKSHKSAEKNEESCAKIADDLKTLNIRKAPAKKSNVFFTTSPKNKAASAKSKMKKDIAGQAWFDLDSVYGFTSED